MTQDDLANLIRLLKARWSAPAANMNIIRAAMLKSAEIEWFGQKLRTMAEGYAPALLGSKICHQIANRDPACLLELEPIDKALLEKLINELEDVAAGVGSGGLLN